MAMEQDQNAPTRVLYNQQCPVCNFEISHYADYAERSDLPLRFEDLNTQDLADWGLTRDQAAKRLYLLKDGQMLGGVDAFLVLWREMPRYRWLAKIVGLPGVKQVAAFGYDWIVAPLIYRWYLSRRRRGLVTQASGD